jgi:hypothetical protein
MTQDPRGEEPPYGWPSHPGSPVDRANSGGQPQPAFYQRPYDPASSGTVYIERAARLWWGLWLGRIAGAFIAFFILIGAFVVSASGASQTEFNWYMVITLGSLVLALIVLVLYGIGRVIRGGSNARREY